MPRRSRRPLNRRRRASRMPSNEPAARKQNAKQNKSPERRWQSAIPAIARLAMQAGSTEQRMLQCSQSGHRHTARSAKPARPVRRKARNATGTYARSGNKCLVGGAASEAVF